MGSMKINSTVRQFGAIAGFLATAWLFTACATRDVFPVAQIKSSSPGLGSDGQSVQITVLLNGPTNREISIPIVFTGSAVNGVHYTSSASAVTIRAGQDSGQISLQSIPAAFTDSLFIRVELQAIEGVIIGNTSSLSIPIVNANLDTDGDGIPDVEDDCPGQPGPAANGGCPWPGLIVNEILYDPPADVAGDANQDGTRDPLADEFVEIFNDGPALDISGYTLSDASVVRHTFAAGTTLNQNGVIVVFGGGNPPAGAFGNAQVAIASTGQLNLNNAGDLCILKDLSGSELFLFDISQYSGDPNEAYTRNPDLRGNFVLHSAIPEAAGALFSPGKKLNGTPFTP
jgi:hypothetical protein